MSYAAESVSAEGTAKAKIIQAAVLTHETGALGFGVLVSNTAGGTVSVPAVANPNPNDGGMTRAAGTVSSDRFTLSNLDTAVTYAVSVPATVEIASGGDKMSVALKLSITSVTGKANETLYVGGDLTVGANQAAGSYTGTYTVTVTY